MSEQVKFSVIMPVCHGGRFLRECLNSLRNLDSDTPPFEAILAAEANDDESRLIAGSAREDADFDLKYIAYNSKNRALLLNSAVAASSGEDLAFTDDDCILPASWLKDWHAALEGHQDIGLAGGSDHLAAPEKSLDLALDCVINSFLGGGTRNDKGAGAYYPRLWNMAMKRSVALSVALPARSGCPQVFNESLPVHEDVELSERVRIAGLTLAYVPNVRVEHYRDTTLKSFLRRNFLMARTCRQFGIHRLPHTMLSAGMLSLCAFAALSLLNHDWLIVPVACLALYVCILAATALNAFFKSGRISMLPLVPFLLAGVHVARASGYLSAWRRGILVEERR
jgi:GT2 family glycosyltransferase